MLPPPLTLVTLIERRASSWSAPAAEALAEVLKTRFGKSVRALFFYGSCLRAGEVVEGILDFYVVVDSYDNVYRSRAASLANRMLPPNVFYLEIPYDEDKLRAKYAIISLDDFERGVSMRGFHSYLWARFCQPIGLLHACSADVRERLCQALARAVQTFATRVVPCLPAEFTDRELWVDGFSLTYAAELRAERKQRAREVYEADRSYYDQLAAAVLESLPLRIEEKPGSQPARYLAHISRRARRLSRLAWALRRVQGKALSLARLMKAAFTFDGGLDYLAWKIHRHSGVVVEVTPRMRRHPILAGVGVAWRLYRRGGFR